MHKIAIIPARYSSTRLPAKPLRLIAGKTLIHRVYTSVITTELFDNVVIATDHLDIYNHAKEFTDEVIMTSPEHLSGTDRIEECAKSIKTDLVVNIQGDEPFISREPLKMLLEVFKDEKVNIASMMTDFENEDDIFNHNFVKVVCNNDSDAMYFSRSVIPCTQNFEPSVENWKNIFFRHIGVYAYRPEMLKKFVSLPQSKLEKIEKLEQLRLLENGYKIRMVMTDYKGLGIDTLEDIIRAEDMILNRVI